LSLYYARFSKTLKYCPSFPERFGSAEDARAFCREFFPWYNGEHRHSGIGLLTPETVHYGRSERVTARRRLVLAAAYHQHPERFVRGKPQPPSVPEAAWINKPSSTSRVSQDPAIPENDRIPGVPGHGPSSDPRSSDILEGDSSSRSHQAPGFDNNFVAAVSQNHRHVPWCRKRGIMAASDHEKNNEVVPLRLEPHNKQVLSKIAHSLSILLMRIMLLG
jgi:putative transposase